MFSQRSLEGYLVLDHRESPGVSDEVVAKVTPDMPVGFGRKFAEAPTMTCPHCQAIQVLNPNRERDRPFCRSCGTHICDRCALDARLTGQCRPWSKVVDEWFQAVSKGLPAPIFERPTHG